ALPRVPSAYPGSPGTRLPEAPARRPQATPRPLAVPAAPARIPAALPQHTRTDPPALSPSLLASLEGPGRPAGTAPAAPAALAGGAAVRKPPRQRAARAPLTGCFAGWGWGPCLYRSVSQVCVENSLIFRSNTPYSTDIVSDPGGQDPLFCVQLDDSKLNYYQQPQDIKESDFAEFLEKYGRHSFLVPSQVQPSFSAFYRAGDPILIYFDSSSVLSMLRQPIKMGTSGLCVDGNPAGFLESKSTSCARIFANLSKSCMTDPALDAASYYRDFTVLKVHFKFLVNVTAVSPPGAPHMKDNTCINVVSEVIYEIEYSGTSGIQSVSVQFKVSNISVNSRSSLQQHFTMHFWVSISILLGILPSLCSFLISSLSPILEDSNCSYIQQKLYKAFQGMSRTEDFAVTGSAHSTQAEEWMTILIENCGVEAVNCTSCCMVPVTLEIQILWTKVGLLSNPQAQVVGTRHFYHCQPLKFLDMSMVPVTTIVTFTDMTDWPEPPRGQPQMHWKLPFDIFFPFKVALNVERTYRGDLAGNCSAVFIAHCFTRNTKTMVFLWISAASGEENI
uniref:Tectonic family member 3 n=1 Tax=Junco hyemalis TaxID=40217 RepID=A0A8C5JB63_JUNHY